MAAYLPHTFRIPWDQAMPPEVLAILGLAFHTHTLHTLQAIRSSRRVPVRTRVDWVKGMQGMRGFPKSLPGKLLHDAYLCPKVCERYAEGMRSSPSALHQIPGAAASC